MKKRQIAALAAALCLALAGVMPVCAQEKSPQLHQMALTAQQQNPDVVGWIQIPAMDLDAPGASFSVPVLQSEDNQYYLRRDIEGKYDYAGSVFADFRCRFGGEDGFSTNTVLYGHSFGEPEGLEELTMFDCIKLYRDAEYAAQYPCLYFATTEATMTWEVFAVSVVSTDFFYNTPEPEEGIFSIVEKMRASSLHPFESVSVSAGDKLLTLSTVDYSEEDSPSTNRFVVMAKLVEQPKDTLSAQGAAENNFNPGTGK